MTDRCPNCGHVEAWHGVIVEPGEADRYACDECGTNVEVDRPARVSALEVIGASTVLAALVLAIALVLTTPATPETWPTDAPSGERAYVCAEADRACNELVDVQESQR